MTVFPSPTIQQPIIRRERNFVPVRCTVIFCVTESLSLSLVPNLGGEVFGGIGRGLVWEKYFGKSILEGGITERCHAMW
jgi:hypothetical protein